MTTPDAAKLLSLAESVADGSAINWDAAEAAAGADERAVVRQLRILANLATLHRSLPSMAEDLPPASAVDRSSNPAPAIGSWAHLALVERLGGGTFGEVYRAWDGHLEREVALKLLRVDESTDDLQTSRVAREGRLLARVRHPNVITVYGVAVHEGRVGLWMELIRGTTLEQLLLKRGPFSAREAALVGIDLCRALAAIHAAGLIHRDVKAQNVMREAGGRIVLMDLGTGREIGPRALPDLAGTPLYLAPEIFQGAPASEKTDLYSLGVLLYHLVTGSFPVRATTIEELTQAHAAGASVRLRDVRADLPTAFVRVVDRIIAKDPDERYASAGALEADLAQALDDGAVPAVIDAPAPPTQPRRVAIWRTIRLADDCRHRSRDPGPRPHRSAGLPLEGHQSRYRAGLDRPDEAGSAAPPESDRAGRSCALAAADPGVVGRRADWSGPSCRDGSSEPELHDRERAQRGSAAARSAPIRSAETIEREFGHRRLDSDGRRGVRAANQPGGSRSREKRSFPRTRRSPAKMLAESSRSLAERILGFLQVLPLANDKDLRPAYSLRRHNIRAVSAFLEAAQYTYNDEHPAAVAPLRRAIEIDPTFVAPRIWLIPGLVGHNNIAEAKEQYAALLKLEPGVSPLEHALIAYAGAILAHDPAGVARSMELALQYAPGNNILLVTLANIKAMAGDCTGALDALAPAVAMRWRYPPVYAIWGACSIQTARFADGRQRPVRRSRVAARLSERLRFPPGSCDGRWRSNSREIIWRDVRGAVRPIGPARHFGPGARVRASERLRPRRRTTRSRRRPVGKIRLGQGAPSSPESIASSTTRRTRKEVTVPDQDLKRVAAKATIDKSFFDALVKDPDQALAGAGIALPPDQLQKLKYGLKNPQTIAVDMVKFIGAVHGVTEDKLSNAIPEWGGVLGGGGGHGGDH